jgi:hypothetical protein
MCGVHQYVFDIHRQRDAAWNDRKNQTMSLKKGREEGRERGLSHTLRKERRCVEHEFGSARNTCREGRLGDPLRKLAHLPQSRVKIRACCTAHEFAHPAERALEMGAVWLENGGCLQQTRSGGVGVPGRSGGSNALVG